MENVKDSLIQPLGARGEKHLSANMRADEKIIAKLKGQWGEGFVLTDHHIYIVKWGYYAGSLFGGRCISFDYRNVVGLEIKKGLLTGVVEVLSPATQNANLSYWAQNQNSAIRSNHAVAFTSTKKLELFQRAVVLARDQMNRTHRG